MQDVVGKELLPYGVEANRVTLDAFLQYAFEQGVCHRRLQPEELFPPQVQKSFRV
jgi:4,5-dihydroxyphthalate decarboxylase